MTLATATINGIQCTQVRSTIPAWGAAYHDVSTDGEHTLAGAVTVIAADAVYKCTVLSGGPAAGRSFFRVVAGAGGWGKTLPKKSYANDAGVKLSTVLVDAANAVGETLDTTTVDQSLRLGPAFVRPEQPAGRLLEQLAPGNWYIGEDGKTRLGQRPKTTLSGTATRTSQLDLARGTVTLASDSISTILPGIVVDGLEAVDVEHEISAKGGLRSTIWGRQGTGNSRRLAAWRTLFDSLDPGRKFRGLWEYRVVTREGEKLNLQPVRVSTGMPDLQRVVVRPGVAGCKATVALGERVVVGFLDANPSYPIVLSHEDADGGGFMPTSLSLANGSLHAARVTDPVQAGPFSGTIISGSTLVKIG